MHDFTFDETLGGVALFIALLAVGAAVIFIIAKGSKKRAQKFKEEHPETATVWIFDRRINGILMTAYVKKVDGQKSVSFGGWSGGPHGAHILPGTHVLSVEHFDASKMDDSTYKKQKHSQISVTLEPSKDYILNFCEIPGQYSVIEGKPE